MGTDNHGAGEDVRAYCVYTNSIDSVRAILERQIIGIHHSVSPKHPSRYTAARTWRYSHL